MSVQATNTDTKQKFDEAKFFLTKMKEDNDNFKYYHSAFLCAARSITLFMQKEYDKVSGFKEWYAVKQNIMRDNDVMKILLDKRNMTVHQKTINTLEKTVIHVRETISLSSVAIATAEDRIRVKGVTKKPGSTEIRKEILWFYNYDDSFDVVNISEQQIGFFEELIVECELKFLQALLTTEQ